MRILFLIRSLDGGGAERQLVLLANGLARKGHDVGVAVFYGGGMLEGDLDGPELFFLEKKSRWDIFSFFKSLHRCVRDFGPEVLHGYMGTANNLSALAHFLFPKVGIVWGIRSTTVDFGAYGTMARLDSLAEVVLSRFADLIIANSRKGRDDAIARGVARDRLIVIPNGIDTEHFQPTPEGRAALRTEWGFGETDIVVGVVGRLDPMKGHEVLLEAARMLMDRGEDIRFVCVGGGHLADSLASASRRLGLDGRVVWAGVRKDMPSVYSAFDVCCLPSLFGEGFPNVLGEAMSCGVPCVTTDVGDAGVVVGELGEVVAADLPRFLADALLRMVKLICSDRIPDTRSRIKEQFSMEKMIADTESVLFEVLRRP